MKSIVKIIVVFFVLNVVFTILPKNVSAQHQRGVSYQVFYDELSPYGYWIDNPEFGYVWVPNEGPDFYPYYSAGHWVYTLYGWTWVSDYRWGWATFHYGRWNFDNYFGWYWVPDNEWGPAWVSWRSGNGYYGWAPLGPNISINVSFGRDYHVPHNHWVFVRDRDFGRSNIHNYYVNRSRNSTIITNTTVINYTNVDNERHTTYVTGPRREEVQRSNGRPINTVNITENTAPGQRLTNNQLQIYRPEVNRNNEDGKKFAPAKVNKRDDVKPVTQRNSSIQQNNTNKTNNNNVNRQTNQNPSYPTNVNKNQQKNVNSPNNNKVNNQPNKQINSTPPSNNTGKENNNTKVNNKPKTNSNTNVNSKEKKDNNVNNQTKQNNSNPPTNNNGKEIKNDKNTKTNNVNKVETNKNEKGNKK